MSSRRVRSRFSVIFLFFTVLTYSQTITSGTVVGSIIDATGAVVPSADVTIEQSETGTVRTTKTNDSGQFRFPFLKPGEYTIFAQATGQTTSKSHFNLLVGQEQQINLTLSVQSVNQSVYVSDDTPLLETENANQASSFSLTEVKNMPINGGDITNIAFTTPGLRLNVGGGNTNFNVNGLPFSSALFTVNGADITEPYNLKQQIWGQQ